MPTRKARFQFDGFDVFLGLFHFWDLKKYRIIARTGILHGAIFFVAQLPRYKKLTRDWLFQQRIFGKYCPLFEDWLFNMEMSSLLYLSPDTDYYVVLPKLHTAWANTELRRFNEKELILLEEMADRIMDKVEELKKNRSN